MEVLQNAKQRLLKRRTDKEEGRVISEEVDESELEVEEVEEVKY